MTAQITEKIVGKARLDFATGGGLAALIGRGAGLERKPGDSLKFTHRVVGGLYQLQSSANLNTWLNYGTPFVATVANAPQYVAVTNTEMFFRVLAVP